MTRASAIRSRELAVSGAFVFSTPSSPADERGFTVPTLSEETFAEALGRPVFPVAQASYSRSRRGVLRGLHYTAAPPGRPKYVSCPRGSALDIIVDTRVGSPSFGRHDVVRFDQEEPRAVYFPVGVGHVFVALEDDTLISYLIRGGYVPEREMALSAFDPALGLPIPEGLEPILSERDRAAPTLAEAEAAGLLPEYAVCRAAEEEFWAFGGTRPPSRR
ncbi:dTDP-4-dehydrorhamnose 3,5-epimerase [Streptomyces cyaneofuscatus]|uniref:dTDP-4-dehydrorhamnose 3,5-epimerase family protein n=1 Tax=Streptomyces cyaneofuscatus TaxID=66883 RepID=UPI002D77BF0B|nr:dTDP-4-dehydrorhamnose 3,5-epimerase [Streptomyces cyaneofuscatus]WRO10166.1 dTDP-4-dehydrorhamnose 3,5-epimerase [Streptomyces cyaneofuscatus]